MALCGVLIRKVRCHILLTMEQSQKRCIIASYYNLQKKHLGEVTFPNLKSILFAYRILCKTLHWSIRAFVSKWVLRIRKYTFSLLNWDVSKRFPK